MKKIVKAMLFLALLGAFILSTQISCQKSNAQTTSNQTVVAANLILYGKSVQVPEQSTDSAGNPIKVQSYEFYLANIDGTNQRKIPIVLPSGLHIDDLQAFLTPGGQNIIFTVGDDPNTTRSIYSCTIDGNNLKKLIDLGTHQSENSWLLGAY